MKQCTKCKGDKQPTINFGFRFPKMPHKGRRAWCKSCVRAYTAAYKKDNKNIKWTKLAFNLSRNKLGYIPYKKLRDEIGAPDKCYLCGLPVSWDTAEMDHVVPVSRGGKNTIANLKWAHRICNRVKHNLNIDELLELFQEIINNQK
ncbi:MAG: HNH endonuclease [Gammaproteobacteria bacterium]|nr:HNH endonuclease [Gammaproteobacteria bacterium]